MKHFFEKPPQFPLDWIFSLEVQLLLNEKIFEKFFGEIYIFSFSSIILGTWNLPLSSAEIPTKSTFAPANNSFVMNMEPN